VKGVKVLGLALLAVILFVSPARANTVTANSIAKQLICQCGCTSGLSDCTHSECDVRDAMSTLIGQRLEQGDSAEQIIQLFVSEYGEMVLAAPPKKGFNLIAWIVPFVALLTGSAVIYFALKTWLGRGDPEPGAAQAVEEGDEEYRYRLEDELGRFGDGGFR
jgi:cytochrome c-type biogenesis protein CcmH